MADDTLVVENLTKRFGPVTAVDGLSFRIQAGQVTALLGGNGAGKTTTIGMVLGLVLPTSGGITALGHDVLRERYRALPRMNFSSPYVDLPHRLSVIENLRVYAHLYGLTEIETRIKKLSQALDLDALLLRRTGTLSAGQRTRVALAKSLINDPLLLLLDEPTASLDPDTADWIRRYLQAYQKRTGATILLASHNMTEVERLAHDVVMMKAGRLVRQGTPSALLAHYGRTTLEDVFLDIARNEDVEGTANEAPEKDDRQDA